MREYHLWYIAAFMAIAVMFYLMIELRLLQAGIYFVISFCLGVSANSIQNDTRISKTSRRGERK